MFEIIKKMFMGLLIIIVNASNHTKRLSTVINLYPNEYSQKFRYYSFAVKLDGYVGSCSALGDLSTLDFFHKQLVYKQLYSIL